MKLEHLDRVEPSQLPAGIHNWGAERWRAVLMVSPSEVFASARAFKHSMAREAPAGGHNGGRRPACGDCGRSDCRSCIRRGIVAVDRQVDDIRKRNLGKKASVKS